MPVPDNAGQQLPVPSSSTTTVTRSPLTPTLPLSDILHHMPPSPVPPEETSALEIAHGGIRKRAASPEPLTGADVLTIRHRVEEMGLLVYARQNGPGRNMNSTPQAINLSSREKELIDMVLRLTDPLPIDPAQLTRQADTIANLTAQRDYILQEIEDERERWRAEKDVWDRTAEALLSQRTKPQKSEDAGRQREIYESEIRTLREKLQDSQRRMSQYESELSRLRPLLLLQLHPAIGNRDTDLLPGQNEKHKDPESDPQYSTSRQHDKGKGREIEPPIPNTQTHTAPRTLGSIPEDRASVHNSRSAPVFKYTPPAFVSMSRPPPEASQSHRQRRNSRERTSKSKRRSSQRHAPLSSDAYSEHLLLAAKRIGRTRATQVSGLLQHAEHEKELLAREQQRLRDMKEQERLERERLDRLATGTAGLAYYRSTADGNPQRVPAAPHTPKKQIHYGPTSGTAPIVFVHTLSPPTPQTQIPTNVTTTSFSAVSYAGSPLASTSHVVGSSRSNQTQKNQIHTLPSNPPTPLDSLLDAARMMDDDAGSKPRRTNGKGRAMNDPESPAPKRRRISGEGAIKPVRTQSTTTVDGREGSLDASSMHGRGVGKDRVRSALDVLADQAAAAFNEPEQSNRRATLAAAKGKGRRRQGSDSITANDTQHDDNTVTSPSAQVESISTSTSTTTSARGRPRTRAPSTGSTRPPSNTGPPAPSQSLPLPSSSSASTESVSSAHASTSASGRPLRSSSRRGAALLHNASRSRERTTAAPASARGTSRPRGRPRGSTIKGRGGSTRPASAPSEPRVISPPRARIIAPPPPRYAEDVVHAPGGSDDESDHVGLGGPGGSGARHDASALQSGQGPDTAGSRSASVQRGASDGERAGGSATSIPLAPPAGPVSPASAHLTYEEPRSDSVTAEPVVIPRLGTSGRNYSPSIAGRPSGLDVEMADPEPEGESETDADAEADADADEDAEADAEGDQEDDGESEPRDAPGRSKSPPPPDPPPPGADGGPPRGRDDGGSDADADADAEGEIELEEGEDGGGAAGGSRSSGTQHHHHQRMTLLARGCEGEGAAQLQARSRVQTRVAARGLRASIGCDDGSVLPRRPAHESHRPDDIVIIGAKPEGRGGLHSEGSQVISLKMHPRECRVKWGKDGQLASPEATPSREVLRGLDVASPTMDYRWRSPVDRNAGKLIYSASHCEPPYRSHVPSILPIVEAA